MKTMSGWDNALLCRNCGKSQWQESAERLVCLQCKQVHTIQDGVVLATAHSSDANRDAAGAHFLGLSFSDNVQVHCVGRRYRQSLEEWLPQAKGRLLDLGAGDGRLSLWALERGFEKVVALDAHAPSLQRLVAEATRRGFAGLRAICSSAQDMSFVPMSFDAILCFEVLYYLPSLQERRNVLRQVHRLLAREGRFVLSEFCRYGRLLADVAAMNLENMRLTAEEGTRLEKYTDRALKVRHFTAAEIEAECVQGGFRVAARRGVSPIPMLFQHAFTFTSYPLRPKLDASTQKLLEELDDQSAEVSDLARNILLLMQKA